MSNKSAKGSKIIRICCEHEEYYSAMNDGDKFRALLQRELNAYPELFPSEITNGFKLNGKTKASEKLDKQQFQKIKLTSTGEVYSVYPAFVMPNLIAYTDEVQKGLLLRKYNVPFSAIAFTQGRDEMFWYRAEKAFSPCSIVGTTIKKKSSCQST
ncbi:hypothetical protein OAO18_05415 [Francisellaceae bacterium]|nr:hypothetical protein [Francisellaceae bacterium]